MADVIYNQPWSTPPSQSPIPSANLNNQDPNQKPKNNPVIVVALIALIILIIVINLFLVFRRPSTKGIKPSNNPPIPGAPPGTP
ncbi:MAG TPA: hypothetical protein VM077_05240 [Candidatus Limnocylindrales bacterium]|nr:hypothetical protein [Candidatus Limnocylindrales bacterium]